MIIMVEGVEMDLLTPWAAVACAKGSGPMAYVENSAGNVIGNAHGFAHGLSVEQIEAVAQIMAAGPEMLAALERLLESNRDDPQATRMALDAIAKARGR